MTPEQAEAYHFNPFDVTKVWYHADAPLIKVGTLTLNKNPQNFFDEVEQAAFAPSHFVPGIFASPDKLLQGRLFAYGDAQRYRLGVNHEQLPPNRPKHADIANYQRDGAASVDVHPAGVNYYPNSFEGTEPVASTAPPALEVKGIIDRHEMASEDIDFEQVHAFWDRVLTEEAKANTVDNIVGHLGGAAQRIQYRQTALFYKAHGDYGTRVATGLGLDLGKVAKLAALTQAERVEATKA
jgi:catalase